MTSKKSGDIIVNSDKVRYQNTVEEYGFQMRNRHFPWWIFLLLLPLLLLIRCQKDIEVLCTDTRSNTPVVGQTVSLSYIDSFLWKDRRWFSADSITLQQQTDTAGVALFQGLPCSVYSYIFHCMSPVKVSTFGECYAESEVIRKFHWTRRITMDLGPRLENLSIKLVDLETGDMLPDASLYYEYYENGQLQRDTVHADAAGVAHLENMRYCETIRLLRGSCYGYADTSRVDEPCRRLLLAADSTALRLRPLKDRFTFYVKNKFTKEPIPDALCKVVLTHPGASHQTQSRMVHTSIDGKGLGFYEEAFVLSTITISATKVHYKPGQLEGGPWAVERFIKQDEDTRTIWLEPDPYLLEFINIDSLNRKPIPGVTNEITITHPNGRVEKIREISNRNGKFSIKAEEDAEVEIISIKDGEYLRKQTRFPKFKEIEDREIRMMPEMDELSFRTVRAEDPSILLPDCHLAVTGSISGTLPPTSSGSGVFTVKMRKAERLSIRASKSGYKTNYTKVWNRGYPYLQESLEHRTIPLKLDLPRCNGGTNVPKQTNEIRHERSYNMGRMSGSSSIWADFYGEADYLTVFDGLGTSGQIIVPKQLIRNKQIIPFRFTQGAITVLIETTSDTSSWEYEVRCP